MPDPRPEGAKRAEDGIIHIVSLLDAEGSENYCECRHQLTGFAPLGTVLVALLV